MKKWIAALAGPTDHQAVRTVRREQAILRAALGIGTGSESLLHPCGLCGREVPENLVVAAHIKPRSECSEDERLDIPTIAILPVCSAATRCSSMATSQWLPTRWWSPKKRYLWTSVTCSAGERSLGTPAAPSTSPGIASTAFAGPPGEAHLTGAEADGASRYDLRAVAHVPI